MTAVDANQLYRTLKAEIKEYKRKPEFRQTMVKQSIRKIQYVLKHCLYSARISTGKKAFFKSKK
jgi:hypothetical protein